MTVDQRCYTAADVAAAFQAGLALGERANATAADAAVGLAPVATLQLVTEEQVRDALDGGPVPTGLDPESIAAARRIARQLNGRAPYTP